MPYNGRETLCELTPHHLSDVSPTFHLIFLQPQLPFCSSFSTSSTLSFSLGTCCSAHYTLPQGNYMTNSSSSSAICSNVTSTWTLKSSRFRTWVVFQRLTRSRKPSRLRHIGELLHSLIACASKLKTFTGLRGEEARSTTGEHIGSDISFLWRVIQFIRVLVEPT